MALMKKLLLAIVVVHFLILTDVGVAAAVTIQNKTSVAVRSLTGCKKVAFTATAGYYSMGHFYSLPGDTVTIQAKWCYSSDVITSYKVTRTTTIPVTEQLRITKQASLNGSGSVLTIGLNGDFNSGVINNVGYIGIAGHVTALGHHRFTNVSGAGG
jgi:hypothetical protein